MEREGGFFFLNFFAEILLATSEENNSDVSMNIGATPTIFRQPLD